jgi:hypothetical protein
MYLSLSIEMYMKHVFRFPNIQERHNESTMQFELVSALFLDIDILHIPTRI